MDDMSRDLEKNKLLNNKASPKNTENSIISEKQNQKLAFILHLI